VALERGFIGIPQEEISDLGEPQLQRYSRFNIELLQNEKE